MSITKINSETKTESSNQSQATNYEVTGKDLNDFAKLVGKEHHFYQKLGMTFFDEMLVG
ncbi:MAG: hypothetical protein V2I33_08725 [Kangiellaceae bacterium]|jgi:hypothetical protein|nr:hypothetical protein [Kangiellaceae bacterium]